MKESLCSLSTEEAVQVLVQPLYLPSSAHPSQRVLCLEWSGDSLIPRLPLIEEGEGRGGGWDEAASSVPRLPLVEEEREREDGLKQQVV